MKSHQIGFLFLATLQFILYSADIIFSNVDKIVLLVFLNSPMTSHCSKNKTQNILLKGLMGLAPPPYTPLFPSPLLPTLYSHSRTCVQPGCQALNIQWFQHYPFPAVFQKTVPGGGGGGWGRRRVKKRHQKLHRLSAAKFQHETLSAPSSSHRSVVSDSLWPHGL